jgi:predicted nucleic acid-binding protein
VIGGIVDTNVLSELRRKRPDSRVLEFFRSSPLHGLYLSAVTLAEIRFGIEFAAPARRNDIADWLAHIVRPMFEGRVLAVSEDVLLRWRQLVEKGRLAGSPGSQPDLIIGATALCHGLRVITRDVGEFARARVPWLNPWTGEAGA